MLSPVPNPLKQFSWIQTKLNIVEENGNSGVPVYFTCQSVHVEKLSAMQQLGTISVAPFSFVPGSSLVSTKNRFHVILLTNLLTNQQTGVKPYLLGRSKYFEKIENEWMDGCT